MTVPILYVMFTHQNLSNKPQHTGYFIRLCNTQQEVWVISHDKINILIKKCYILALNKGSFLNCALTKENLTLLTNQFD